MFILVNDLFISNHNIVRLLKVPGFPLTRIQINILFSYACMALQIRCPFLKKRTDWNILYFLCFQILLKLKCT